MGVGKKLRGVVYGGDKMMRWHRYLQKIKVKISSLSFFRGCILNVDVLLIKFVLSLNSLVNFTISK